MTDKVKYVGNQDNGSGTGVKKGKTKFNSKCLPIFKNLKT